jgi:hypothetical protein
VREPISSYLRVRVQGDGRQVVSKAGAVCCWRRSARRALTRLYLQLWLRGGSRGPCTIPARSSKQDAAATWKKTYGHHPLTAFVDHGPGGTGEPVATLLRPGNAGSNTAADHITTAQLVLDQLPKRYRLGRQTLIRTDAAGGEARDGARVAELTGKLLDGWPKGMRLIIRKERPHPGAQLRITDADGMRITCLATNTTVRPIAELELRHRLRARAEDRIRAARATGLRNLPLHDTAQNRVWMGSSRLRSSCWPGCPCSP